MNREEQNNINCWLALRYGCADDGRAKYRLMWTSELTEYRHGIFLDWNDFVGYSEVEDTRLCPKYHYAMDRWVLEKLDYTAAPLPDLVNQPKLPYETVWIFWKGDDGEYVEPKIDRIDMMCYYDYNGHLRGHKPTEAELHKAELERQAAVRADFREKIDNVLPDETHAISHGSAVYNAGSEAQNVKAVDSPQQ